MPKRVSIVIAALIAVASASILSAQVPVTAQAPASPQLFVPGPSRAGEVQAGLLDLRGDPRQLLRQALDLAVQCLKPDEIFQLLVHVGTHLPAAVRAARGSL